MELIEEIKFIHLKLNSAYSQYCINERINDWYDKYKNKFNQIRNQLGEISQSLKYESLITISKIFDDRYDKNSSNDSICIQGVCRRIISTKIIKDKKQNKSIQNIANNILDKINNNSKDLNDLHTWRDKYFAHYDKKIFNQPQIFVNASYDVKKIILMVKDIFQDLNKIFEKLNEEQVSLTQDVLGNSIDLLFFKYLIGFDILENHKVLPLEEYYKVFKIPKSNHY